MAKPTPGPWKAGARTVTAPETEDRLPLDVRLYGGNADDNRANARQIAASPDLLEAAREYLSTLEHLAREEAEDPDRPPVFYRARLEKLRAVIAKATGSKP